MESVSGLGDITARWMRKPNFVNPLKVSPVLSRQLTAFGVSRMTLHQYNNFLPQKIMFSFLNTNKDEEWEALNFFFSRYGQHQKFWIPTWDSRFVVNQPIYPGAQSLNITDCLLSLANPGWLRVMLLLNNGDIYIRKATAVTRYGDSEVIGLDTEISATIMPTDILLGCYVLLARFDQDTLEVNYHTDGVSEISWTVYELIKEYPV